MRRTLQGLLIGLAIWLLVSIAVGLWLLPRMLLHPPPPHGRVQPVEPLPNWLVHKVAGGGGQPLKVWSLQRTSSRGTLVFLHGFGDEAWGALRHAEALPDWNAVGFTFRGRDLDPNTPLTLGGWERHDVSAVVRWLERNTPRQRIVLAGWSMGAGVALLALHDLERQGAPLGGALLECPFESLEMAASNHLRRACGPLAPLTFLARKVALWRAGRLAGFDPDTVAPVAIAPQLRTPLAFVTGTADPITPLSGVRRIAGPQADLTVVEHAGHCEASGFLPGGWPAWAAQRLDSWVSPRTRPQKVP